MGERATRGCARHSFFPLSRVRERVGVRVLGVDSARLGDAPQHAIDIVDDVIVPESYDTPPVALEPSGATIVALDLGRMLSAVDFDDEGMVPADEVGDKRTDRHLPAEFEPEQTTIPQSEPDASLSIGLIETQVPRQLSFH